MPNLKTTMLWTLNFRVKSRDKAEKEFGRAEELLGRKLLNAGFERYWKIPEHWTCNASTIFEAASEAEHIAGYLMLAQCLATGWYVLGRWPDTFSGIFDVRHGSTGLSSLTWAQFQMNTAEPDAASAEWRARRDPNS